MKKVLLYLASNSPFYTNLYPSIKRGFEEAGCLVEGGPNLLDSEALIQQIETFQPDFVFEMNRVKSEIENFPDEVIHICWLVDFWGRLHSECLGSDILYTWDEEWVDAFHKLGLTNVAYLPPATDKIVYKPIKKEKKYDFTFLGHIPKPWSIEENLRTVGLKDGKKLYFKELHNYIKRFVLTDHPTDTLFQYLKKCNIILEEPIVRTLRYDIMSRSFRYVKRNAYMDLFVNQDFTVSIYGSENWSLYEKFQYLYKGYISDPVELNIRMQEARILLHDGYCPHFRTFDAMCAGIVVAAAKPPKKMENIWSNLGFEDGQEYININMYSKNIDYNLFKNQKFLKEIQYNAREKVLEKHLWVHRAERIMLDIANLRSV